MHGSCIIHADGPSLTKGGLLWSTRMCLGLLSAMAIHEAVSLTAPQMHQRRARRTRTAHQTLKFSTPYNYRAQKTIIPKRSEPFFRSKFLSLCSVENDEENSNLSEEDDDQVKKKSDDDRLQKLSMSKDRAISALSQPKYGESTSSSARLLPPQGDDSVIPPRKQNREIKERPTPGKAESSQLPPPLEVDSLLPPSFDSILPPPPPPQTTKQLNIETDNSSSRKKSRPEELRKKPSTFSSLLPPPLPNLESTREDDDEDLFSSGLSSWEEFLGGSSSEGPKREDLPAARTVRSPPPVSPDNNSKKPFSGLPSISDLFPPEFSENTSDPSQKKSASGMEGVLPVSELFYRSSQSISSQGDIRRRHGEDGEDDADQSDDDGIQGDDEELPFSAEQTDQLSTDGKVKIRRNRAVSGERDKLQKEAKNIKMKNKLRGRKMVRRGMEMLVGGIPINADPPQRCIELSYHEPAIGDALPAWANFISVNSRDFGPLLHSSSIDQVTDVEKGLFCEHFVNAAMKWDICPKELRAIVKTHTLEQMIQDNKSVMKKTEDPPAVQSYDDLLQMVVPSSPTTNTVIAGLNPVSLVEIKNESGIIVKPMDGEEDNIVSLLTQEEADSFDDKEESATAGRGSTPAKGFGKTNKMKKNKRFGGEDQGLRKELDIDDSKKFTLGGELKFSIGVTRLELESGPGGAGGHTLRRVIERGLETAIHSELSGFFRVRIAECKLSEHGEGGTAVSVEFNMDAQIKMKYGDVNRKASRINTALAQAMDDGDVQLAMAAAAREETSWPTKVRDRVVEEFLFEDDDDDGPLYDDEADASSRDEEECEAVGEQEVAENEYDGPFGMPGSTVYAKDDIFLGGGNDGVFNDYSEGSIRNAPYKGQIGPRLLDAVTARARDRQPRVIAIGDVHGCIDELQDLLRACDYQPGDVVVFLGDLVSKGPDSMSVVQMAREIGAIGIRGNHDFEVIRWHQAIKSGVDPPVVGSEHFHIASCLSKADMKWMYSLPWFISSKELGALFVHAGFVSGIRLAKQNPRLMMNMRSILPDGTVTSKFFNNWPWARLWDGPQTVLFGHDADRGLQQYEHAIGLDTGCVYGGRLTACILPEKRLVSVSARREYFKYRRKHYD